jgi:hypothetical protein
MHQPLNAAAQGLVDESVRAADSYFNYTNNLLGIVGCIAMGVLDTSGPSFAAHLCQTSLTNSATASGDK